MRIHTKLLLIFLSLSLLPLALIGWFSYTYAASVLQKTLGLSFQQIAHETVDKVDRGLTSVHENVRIWSDLELMQEVITGDVDGKISSFLMGIGRQTDSFAAIMVSDTQGVIVAADDPSLINVNLGQTPLFQQALAGNASVQDAHIDPVSGEKVVSFAFPIHARFAPEKVVGLLAAHWRLQEMSNMIRPSAPSLSGSRILLIGQTGEVLADSSQETDTIVQPRNSILEGFESARLAQQRQHGYRLEQNADKRRFIVGYDAAQGYRGFPGFGWGVLVLQDATSALAPIQRLKTVALIVGALVSGVVAFVCFLLSRHITDPVLRIAEAARRVVEENFDVQVNYTSRDELGSLTDTFNQMVRNLKAQRAQLVQKAYVENIVASLSELLLVLAPDGHIRTVNRAGCKMLGRSAAELMGQPVHTIVEQINLPRQDTDSSQPIETHLLAKNGGRIPVLFSSAALRNAQGQIEGIVCVAQDITDRKKSEETLLRYTQELSRSNAELEQFAYVASHDLQEPLRLVASYTQLLAKRYSDQLDKDAHEFIEYAVQGALRMQRLISDLLQFSRVTSQAKPLAPVSLDLIIDEALANVQARIGETNAAIVREGPDGIVAGDLSQLVRVFQNLISNALKFQKSNAVPRVLISKKLEDDRWHIQVQDNGIGINLQFKNKLFVIFQRLHTRDEYPGNGVGLAICKKIVERHGGQIWVESEAAKGTTFHFTLRDAQR